MEEVLFSVGPVQMSQEILALGGKQLPYFRTDEFSKVNFEIQDMIRECVYTSKKSRVITLTASGTGAMEATIMNCLNKEDKALVVCGGGFGERFVKLCDIFAINYDVIRLEQGCNLTPDMLEQYNGKGYTALVVNAHETSTGVLYDLDMLGEFCNSNNMLFIVDAISSFLADEIYMDKWHIDALIISSQKALSLPPGLANIIVSERAIERVMNNCVQTLYFDFKDYIKNMERGQTPFTPAVGIILQLHSKLLEVKSVGVDKIIAETRNKAEYFREKIEGLPFSIPSQRLSNALTPLQPKSKNAYSIYKYLKEHYQLVLCPNGGNLRDRLVRVGHIGDISNAQIDRLVAALWEMEREKVFDRI